MKHRISNKYSEQGRKILSKPLIHKFSIGPLSKISPNYYPEPKSVRNKTKDPDQIDTARDYDTCNNIVENKKSNIREPRNKKLGTPRVYRDKETLESIKDKLPYSKKTKYSNENESAIKTNRRERKILTVKELKKTSKAPIYSIKKERDNILNILYQRNDINVIDPIIKLDDNSLIPESKLETVDNGCSCYKFFSQAVAKREKTEEEKNKAATKIQKVFRGYLVRRNKDIDIPIGTSLRRRWIIKQAEIASSRLTDAMEYHNDAVDAMINSIDHELEWARNIMKAVEEREKDVDWSNIRSRIKKRNEFVCSICLQDIQPTECTITSCVHCFHTQCIHSWSKYCTDNGTQPNCPKCRSYYQSREFVEHIFIPKWAKVYRQGNDLEFHFTR